jgi:peptidyl-prolyl cis-trans isomerase B (cyclophilin B)
VPNSKQRREAARRHLERQLARRDQKSARHRKMTVLVTVFGTLVTLVIAVVAVVLLTGEDKKGEDKKTTATGGVRPCGYNAAPAEGNKNLKDVGMPPDPDNTPSTGTENVKLMTTRGEIDIQLDRASAPCAVQSWDYLISKKFYDKTPCHRLVNQGIYVLQCGDPSGTGSGGATYKYKEENVAKASYGEGVVAMAKSQEPGSTGTQFFIIYKDSSGGLSKDYSVVGKVTKGLEIVKRVAAGGLGADKTAPKLPIGITTATIAG